MIVNMSLSTTAATTTIIIINLDWIKCWRSEFEFSEHNSCKIYVPNLSVYKSNKSMERSVEDTRKFPKAHRHAC